MTVHIRFSRGGAHRRLIGLGLLAAGAAVTAGCRPAAPVRAAESPVEVLKTPDGGIQPQAVTDGSGTLHLVYFKGEARGGDLFYRTRAPGSAAWSAPVRVNDRPGSAVAAGTIRGGQVALGKGGRVHVVWFGASGAGGGHGHGGGAPLLYTRLNDARTAFEPARNLMQFTTTLDGGGSVAADGAGNVYAAWHGNDGKTTSEEERRLWIARSRDEGRTFSREAAAWGEPTGACACCSVKAFADSEGALHVLYRSAAAKVNRDMYLLTSTDRGGTFQGSRVDEWKVDTWPMSSEALVEGPNGVFAAWETAGQVRFARLDPATRRAGTPVSAPGSGPSRKHPTLAVNPACEVLFAWTEGTGWERGGALAWQLYDRNGRPLAEKGRLEDGIPVWGLPTAVARRNGGFTLLH